MFEQFESCRIQTTDVEIFLRIGGSGPPLLLLHGYPQSHVMWHRVAPALTNDFTVVCADLRGYGDSGKPPGDPAHRTYSKRASAADMVEVMDALGFDRFMVAGHDRGGRVTHRMCLDHPERVAKAALLDIVPTRTLFENTNKEIATGYYHWFFLIQPELPEQMIGAAPLAYLRSKLGAWAAEGGDAFAPEARAEYERCFLDPATIHASCEDYRAAAGIDLEHDRADEDARIACPLLVLWGENGLMHRHFDVLATWREKAAGPVVGKALACGHYLPEEAPEATLAELRVFFGG